MTPEQLAAKEAKWDLLLKEAVEKPGLMSKAFRSFHNYSVGNQVLAFWQCAFTGIQPGPLASYNRWKELGRHVRQGEHAILLWMPITSKRSVEHEDGTEEVETAVRFVLLPKWFVLSQTEGADYQPEPIPGWDTAGALTTLDIVEEDFDALNGNILGYASRGADHPFLQGEAQAHSGVIRVSPLGDHQHATRFHEIAHIVLGHVAEGPITDETSTPRTIREVEAESVALLCLETLNLPGADYSRGYIQNWYGTGEPIPDASARRIFAAADKILRAGRTVPVETEQEVVHA